MKVSIKDLSVSMDLKTNGITFDVYDNKDKFLGDLRIGKGTIEWCKGKTQSGNGIQVKWPDFIEYFESKSAGQKKKAAKKTSKPAVKTTTKDSESN